MGRKVFDTVFYAKHPKMPWNNLQFKHNSLLTNPSQTGIIIAFKYAVPYKYTERMQNGGKT